MKKTSQAFPLPLHAAYTSGDMTFLYFLKDGKMSFSVIPSGWEKKIPSHQQDVDSTPAARAFHTALNIHLPAYDIEPLAHLKLQQDSFPAGGIVGSSLKNSGTMDKMKFVRQSRKGNEIRSVLQDDRGYTFTHVLTMFPGSRYFQLHTEFTNKSGKPAVLELQESFSLAHLSLFQPDQGLDKYRIHRYRSFWSGEGREVIEQPEELGMEPSWARFSPRSIRFGQRSTAPVREFFPTLVLEDTAAGVVWGAQMGTLGPWQMEIYRVNDFFTISGGSPDNDFNGWQHTVKNGETYRSMPAVLTCAAGSADLALSRLTDRPREQREHACPADKDFPLMFNEFCSTWANPYPEKVLPELPRVQELGVKFFTLDDGWFTHPGDWASIKTGKYPEGFGAFIEQIRAKGFIPGLWFEPEHCVEESELFHKHPEWMLRYKGNLLKNGTRYILDMRKKAVWNYLDRTMAKTIRTYGIGYIKIDYNTAFTGAETPNGTEPDAAQEYVQAVHGYYSHLKELFPELVIEICASGGHRLTSEWMKFGDQASFSDAHESLAIPLVAANTMRQIPMSSNQVWATLREDDSRERLSYTLCAGFLGRLCFSGYVSRMPAKNFAIVKQAAKEYDKVRPFLAAGDTAVLRGLASQSYDAPKGWQAVIRTTGDGKKSMAVIHLFGDAPKQISIPLPSGKAIESVFAPAGTKVILKNGTLQLSAVKDYTGLVVWLKNR